MGQHYPYLGRRERQRLSRLTYQYVGGSTTLYIGSGKSGVNLYGINLIYDKETTLTPTRSLNNGKTYNLLGIEVDENYKGIVIRDGKKISAIDQHYTNVSSIQRKLTKHNLQNLSCGTTCPAF